MHGLHPRFLDRRDPLATKSRSGRRPLEDVFYFFADCPFLDIGITRRMHANHRRYWADYTFADGYPYGLTPEISDRETVSRLRGLAAEGTGAPAAGQLFSLIRKDINSFDIETEISPVDLRMLRVSLTADTERNFLLLSRIVDGGGRDAESVCRFLSEQPRSLRTLPAFFPIQIVERCPQACSYCPYPRVWRRYPVEDGLMPVESFSALVSKISRSAGTPSSTSPSGASPPCIRAIFEIIGAALQEPGLDLVIETSGIGWQPGIFSRVRAVLRQAAHLDRLPGCVHRGDVPEAARAADSPRRSGPRRSSWPCSPPRRGSRRCA